MVGLPDHGPGHALGEGLEQDIVRSRHVQHAQVVRCLAGRADQAQFVRLAPEHRPHLFRGLLVNDAVFPQGIRQGAAAPRPFGRCDHLTIPGTQEYRRLLAKVAGLQQLPEVLLRLVQPQQHTEGLALILQRGVKNHHRLIGDPGAQNHGGTALPPHSVEEIVPIPAVAGAPVGGQVDAVPVGKAESVKIRVVLQLPEQLDAHVPPAGRHGQQVGVVVHPPLGVG